MSTGRHHKPARFSSHAVLVALIGLALVLGVVFIELEVEPTNMALVSPPSSTAAPETTPKPEPRPETGPTSKPEPVIEPEVKVKSDGPAVEVAGVREPVEEPVESEPLSDLVSEARAYLDDGIPYVWGGKNQSGMDCSGFVWSAFKNLGLDVPYRNSTALKTWVEPVSESEARSGDLVFWPGHVGIYAGDNRVIDMASSTGTITERKTWGSPTFGRIP